MTQDGFRILTGLAQGRPPDVRLARQLMVGFERALGEWRADLDGYVAQGGGLLRIIWAAPGHGKTHLARALEAEAATRGYAVCRVDAAADHADDDLTLYRAFCTGLRCPEDVLEGVEERGLGRVLRRVGLGRDSVPELRGAAARRQIRMAGDVPAPALSEFLPSLLESLRLEGTTGLSRERRLELEVVLNLIAGEPVQGTRSLGRLRQQYPGPLIRALRKTPSKRDARLWLETVLRVLPKLGFPGVLWIVDEHDEANRLLLDRHIQQLRRLADRLAEGRLPGVFAVYLVLSDFQHRIGQSHGALDQRLRPILRQPLYRRALSSLEDLRGMTSDEFFSKLGPKIYSLVATPPMPSDLQRLSRESGQAAAQLGGADVRSFVQSVASWILDHS